MAKYHTMRDKNYPTVSEYERTRTGDRLYAESHLCTRHASTALRVISTPIGRHLWCDTCVTDEHVARRVE